MNLLKHQQQFLLKNFFENERFPGWKNIATKLLETGECVVAGKECIWKGGIGNFIQVEEREDFIDFLVYKFDLKNFLSSAFYKDIKRCQLQIITSQMTELAEKRNQIEVL